MAIIKDLILAAICTLGFCILFNIPRKQLIYASLIGALGWLVYTRLNEQINTVVMSAFFGALTVGSISEGLARVRKVPVPVLLIPGLIPLVPGYGLYYAMLKVVEADYQAATEMGVETLLVAIAISSAVLVSTSIGKRFGSRVVR